MYKKRLIIVFIAIVLLGAASYTFVFFNNQKNQKADTNEKTVKPPEGSITKRGVITCLPKIGDGPHTDECALGLKSEEGSYFGLRNLSDHDQDYSFVSPDITVEVTGTLIHEDIYGPDRNRYDTLGIIQIDTISEL